ncbi:hypothetical protein TNCV_1968031 [Trichonephila clavipes]|nr:hypothetical protein TNCV_1968031 [Trichonephila clavipes]
MIWTTTTYPPLSKVLLFGLLRVAFRQWIGIHTMNTSSTRPKTVSSLSSVLVHCGFIVALVKEPILRDLLSMLVNVV